MKPRYVIPLAAALALSAPIGWHFTHTAIAEDQQQANDADQGKDQQKMEKKFFKDAASDNNLEIKAAQLAEERSNDPQIKQVAQMMEQDHTQANQLLKQIADQNHIDVSTDDLNKVDAAQLDELKDLKEPVFDHMFVFANVGDHAKDELVLAYHQNHGSDACRQYATQILPKVQMHLHALEQIARPMAGLSDNAQPAGEHEIPDQHAPAAGGAMENAPGAQH